MPTPTYSPTQDAWASYELAIELLRQRAEAEPPQPVTSTREDAE